MKNVVGFILIIITAFSCCPEEGIVFDWVNNSDATIAFLAPHRNSSFRSRTVSMADIGTLDTAMLRFGKYFYKVPVKAYSHRSLASGFTSIKQITNPYDTLRIFVFDYSFEREKDAPIKLSDIYENDGYYYRYDLSVSDLESLYNGAGHCVITYPPDERMRNIKMWPLYPGE